jgi:hypothetical protein
MTGAVYVIDTSYLDELFAIPGFSEVAASAEVRKRFAAAAELDALFIVPLPCLFEFADHLAVIPNGRVRLGLAEAVCRAVTSSFAEAQPWTITPSKGLDAVPEVLKRFAAEYVKQKIGLSDAFVIQEANRLKAEYLTTRNYQVHIWTRDIALKSWEPDAEPKPFV